jgi:hypothetical protein
MLFAGGMGQFGEYGKKWEKKTGEEEARLTAEYYTQKQALRCLVAFDSARFPADTGGKADRPRIALDPNFARDYSFRGYPWVVILDRRGILRARLIFNENQIDTIVTKLLSTAL